MTTTDPTAPLSAAAAPTPADLDLDRLRELEQAATPAPWTPDTDTRGDCVLFGPDGRFVANAQSEPHWVPNPDGSKRAVMFDVDRRDVELIAAMRNALPSLLTALAHLTELVEKAWRHRDDAQSLADELMEQRDEMKEALAAARAEAEQAHAVVGSVCEVIDSYERQHRFFITTKDLRDLLASAPSVPTVATVLASDLRASNERLTCERDAARAEAEQAQAAMRERAAAYFTQCAEFKRREADRNPEPIRSSAGLTAVAWDMAAEYLREPSIWAEGDAAAPAATDEPTPASSTLPWRQANKPVEPLPINGCRHCGAVEPEHANRWTETVGWHTWVDPGNEVRKTRLLLRREKAVPDTTEPGTVRTGHDSSGDDTAATDESWRDFTIHTDWGNEQDVYVACRLDDVCEEVKHNPDERYLTLGEAVDWAKEHAASPFHAAPVGDGGNGTAEAPDELCSDKNGFHNEHRWMPDPCEPYRWCPGYPVPRKSNGAAEARP